MPDCCEYVLDVVTEETYSIELLPATEYVIQYITNLADCDVVAAFIAQVTANSGGPPATGAHAVFDGTTLIWSAILGEGVLLESGVPLLLEDGSELMTEGGM
jgi:hypothetical protein